jgi:hypothetical protein
VSEDMVNKTKASSEEIKRQGRIRKRWAMEIVGMLAEGMEKKPAEIMEMMDFELE